MSADASTPLMRQYHAIKQQAPGALLLFRLGDFYELFFEDAVTAARELEITLTSRSKEKEIPMCGVPAHSAEGYIARLVQKGYRVAICEQMEDPRLAKKLVKRELTRVITPGTATDASLLRPRENNYLAAIARAAGKAGIAHADVSTGEFKATELDAADALAALEQLNVREVLSAGDPGECGRAVKTEIEGWTLDPEYAARTLREHFGLLSLDGCGLGGKPLATAAAGALLHYVRETQKSALDHIEPPAFYDRAEAMALDAVTVRNLELFEPLFSDGGASSTLAGAIDRTCTGMGARLLRRRLARPSLDAAEIEARLDAIDELQRDAIARGEIRKTLSSILDIERLLAKVTVGTATPRDLLALGRSLDQTPALRRAFGAARLQALSDGIDDVPEVRAAISSGVAEDAPVNPAQGGAIRAGFSAELDELRGLSKNSRQFIAAIEQRERGRTGIASLKVRFNNVFGYYIEISKANLKSAPADYERKQTLTNAERFTTPELKELESKVLDAEEKILALERALFEQIRQTAAGAAAQIRGTAAAVAELDVTCTLAEVAATHQYVRPRFQTSGEMRIEQARHPVIEQLSMAAGERFIPNDLYLNLEGQFIGLITGPNMGGKSTYLRQTALIAILAQAGSFVPASSATLPLIDRVFTRIGAADNLARGRSTFMVEMTETAVILNTATSRSLIVLDEIGRGTSTYDGLALAWSVVEYVHQKIRALTLFATHYHELTVLGEQLDGVRNLRVSVKEAGDRILFLRRVEPGAADRSYGIEVARLAALPPAVIERAREVLAMHERSEEKVTEELAPQPGGPMQIRLFEPVNHEIAERIRRLNIDELRPVEALRLLNELQQELKSL